MHISRIDSTICYADSSPSELIHNTLEKYICVGFVNFFHIEKPSIKHFAQFKNTRGLGRKLLTQSYLIECIENGLIQPAGIIMWNYSKIALESAQTFLVNEKLIPPNSNYDELIEFNEVQLTIGHLLSLTWYSIVTAVFLKQIGIISKVTNKRKAALFFDLLPGDNVKSRKNLNIVKFLFNETYLDEFRKDSLAENNLEQIGFGYGIKDGSTKALKYDHEFTVTDWIVQSFYSLIRYEREFLKFDSNEYKMSELARYLLKKGVFKIQEPIKLM